MLPGAIAYFGVIFASSVLIVVAPERAAIGDWFLLTVLVVASFIAGLALKRWAALWLALLIPVGYTLTEVLWSANLIESPDGYYVDGLYLIDVGPFLALLAVSLIALGVLTRQFLRDLSRFTHTRSG